MNPFCLPSIENNVHSDPFAAYGFISGMGPGHGMSKAMNVGQNFSQIAAPRAP